MSCYNFTAKYNVVYLGFLHEDDAVHKMRLILVDRKVPVSNACTFLAANPIIFSTPLLLKVNLYCALRHAR